MLQDIYYNKNDFFYVICNSRVQCNRITNRKKSDADETVINDNGLLALSDQSITQMQIQIGINTVVFHKA